MNEACFFLNTSDWKYTSNAMYFSVYVCEVTAQLLLELLTTPVKATTNEADGDFIDRLVRAKGVCLSSSSSSAGATERIDGAVVHVWRENIDARDRLTAKANMFQQIFKDIDGVKLTFRDRNGVDFSTYPFQPLYPQYHQRTSLNNNLLSQNDTQQSILSSIDVDERSLSYNEVEFTSFVALLHSVPVMDGEIFYDLGCGVGKSLVAAALSGICLLKVIGFEVLPSLSLCCSDVLQSLMAQAEDGLHLTTAARSAQMVGKLRPSSGLPSAAVGQSDNLIEWLTGPPDHEHDNFDEDDMSINSFLTQSNCSYQLAAIPDLKERLKRARIKLPIMECR
jgi:hypothetical protein